MKTMLGALSAFVLAISLMRPVVAFAADEPEAVAAAEAWLKLADAQDTTATWKSAAAPFRLAITTEDWAKALRAARGPLGKVASRRLKSATRTHSLPGAPDGTYVVIQYETTFENKKGAIETITPMQEKDGKWRVSGYFVR